MSGSQDQRLASIGAALAEGDGARAAALHAAWQQPPPGHALLAELLLDRQEALPGLAEAADAEGLASALQALGLPAGPDMVAALRQAAATPLAEPARVHLASLLLVAGRHALAETLLRPFWRGAHSSPMLARAISGTWMLLGRDGPALEAARIAADALPVQPEPQEHLAGLLLRAGQPGPALLAAGRALGVDPAAHNAWRLASAAYLELGQTAEAIAAANRAARLSANHAPHAEQVRVAHAAELDQDAPPASRAPMPGAAIPAPIRRHVPPGWAVPAPEALAPRRVSLRAALAARARIVDALVLRETRTMFTASRLGYAWALVEPLSHVLLLSAVFFFLGHDSEPPVGQTMLTFYMTGVLSFLFFAHLTERAMDLPAANRSLLQVPALGLFDIFAGKAVLSATTDLVVAAVTFAFLLAIGVGEVPHDPASMIGCYAVLFLLACGVASFNLVASSYSSAWEKLWPSFLRVQYFTCGVFYHPLDMPEDIRGLILLNPLVHVTEWMRQAYFHSYESPFLDIPYLLRCAIAAALLGTLVFAATARQLRRMA